LDVLKEELIKALEDYLNDKTNLTLKQKMTKLYKDSGSGSSVLFDNTINNALRLIEIIGYGVDEVTNMSRVTDEEIKSAIKELKQLKPRKILV